MRFERLTNEKHEMYKKALELYSISFPSHEQRDMVSQTKILNDDDYYFNLIYDEEAFVGLALCWETKSFVYVEHFCILPEMRNKKYGQKVLQLLRQNGRMVILEIDPPVDVNSIRRKRFYERGGFVENPYSMCILRTAGKIVGTLLLSCLFLRQFHRQSMMRSNIIWNIM